VRAVSLQEAQSRLEELLKEVQAGEEVLILDQGVTVARLVPETPKGALFRLEERGLLRRGKGKAQLEDLPLPSSQQSVLEALLEEREEG